MISVQEVLLTAKIMSKDYLLYINDFYAPDELNRLDSHKNAIQAYLSLKHIPLHDPKRTPQQRIRQYTF
jgi:hypothetical protein